MAWATLYDQNFIVVTIDQMKTIDLKDAILPVFFAFNASIVRTIRGINQSICIGMMIEFDKGLTP